MSVLEWLYERWHYIPVAAFLGYLGYQIKRALPETMSEERRDAIGWLSAMFIMFIVFVVGAILKKWDG